MKRILTLIPFAAALGLATVVLAGTVCQTTSVSSSSSPVAVLTPGLRHSGSIKPRAAAAVPVLIFPYTGAVPTAVPSPAAVMELSAGQAMNIPVECDEAACLDGAGDGWAAVLESGTTAVTVDACSR